jgi:hypothetical protein
MRIARELLAIVINKVSIIAGDVRQRALDPSPGSALIHPG